LNLSTVRLIGGREETAMNECFPDKSRIAREMLSYLSAHPDAQDTLDGIVQWWLRERKSDQHTTLVKEVLADLVTQGLVEKIQTEGQTSHYRMRPKHKK
jgi:hypothetical protein